VGMPCEAGGCRRDARGPSTAVGLRFSRSPSFAQDDRVASTPAFSCKSGKAGAASFAEAWTRSVRDGPAPYIDHHR
jgi:hypothetical protein